MAAPVRILVTGLAAALMAAGCGGRNGERVNPATATASRSSLLETVGEFAVVRLHADGFEALTPKQRVHAYYLYRAALAGRDIYIDQVGRHNLEVRDLLEEILTHPQGLPRAFVESLLRYLKLFWINNGNHNERTRLKFVPEFSSADLAAAARTAMDGGARIELALGETLAGKLARLERPIFDPGYEPLVTCRSPGPGQDLLTCSSVNFYDGVTLADLAGFTETHPLNSRLVRRDGRLREEIYRAGRGDDVPPGRYAAPLRAAAGFLQMARARAGDGGAEALGLLAEYFATGDAEAFRRYNLAWLAHDAPVDTINGFIETYKDPRGRKGAWEAMVYIADPERTRLQRALAAEAAYFEGRAPWDARYRRGAFTPPLASAVTLLAATGDAGPMPPAGVNLPNDDAIGERHGHKSQSFINVIEAASRATRDREIREFFLPEDRRLLERHGAEADLLHTALHEVLGHPSGRTSPTLRGEPRDHLREYDATLEEARADLVALHAFFDPRLQAIGAISSPAVAEAACRDYATADLRMLRRVRHGDRLEDDHMRATHLVVGHLRHAGAVEEVRRDGRTYHRVADLGARRRGVAGLLADLQRIKAEGDYAGARDLVERFGTRIDPRLRDEVVARAGAAGIPSYVAFVMPDLMPVRDAGDEVIDARLESSSDLTMQMLRYSGKFPLEGGRP